MRRNVIRPTGVRIKRYNANLLRARFAGAGAPAVPGNGNLVGWSAPAGIAGYVGVAGSRNKVARG